MLPQTHLWLTRKPHSQDAPITPDRGCLLLQGRSLLAEVALEEQGLGAQENLSEHTSTGNQELLSSQQACRASVRDVVPALSKLDTLTG